MTTRWTHIDEALPDLESWVLVSGYDKSGVAWWDCAERQARGGGGWEWDNNEDGFHTLAKQITILHLTNHPAMGGSRAVSQTGVTMSGHD